MNRTSRKLGIEFELTGLNHSSARPDNDLGSYFRWHSDGSIDSISQTVEEMCPHCDQLHVTEKRLCTGELVISPPQKEKFYMEGTELVSILEWLKQDNPHLSADPEKKCSAHIHVSVDEEELKQIAKYAMAHQDEAFEKWKPLQSRIDYCKKLPDQSVNTIAGQDGDRYRWINIMPAYQRHNTVEFRIFNGTVDINEVRERVQWCLDFIDSALAVDVPEVTVPKKKKSTTGAVAVSAEAFEAVAVSAEAFEAHRDIFVASGVYSTPAELTYDVLDVVV